MVRMFLGILMLTPLAVSAADDTRVSFLEQEVRNLQRQVQVLSRQVDELRTRPERLDPQFAGTGPAPAASAADLPRWVDAGLWKRLRSGMTELEAISSLGPPTSMRAESGKRFLLYAMEIGSSGFLGGSVVVRDGAVIEIRKPTLQ